MIASIRRAGGCLSAVLAAGTLAAGTPASLAVAQTPYGGSGGVAPGTGPLRPGWIAPSGEGRNVGSAYPSGPHGVFRGAEYGGVASGGAGYGVVRNGNYGPYGGYRANGGVYAAPVAGAYGGVYGVPSGSGYGSAYGGYGVPMAAGNGLLRTATGDRPGTVGSTQKTGEQFQPSGFVSRGAVETPKTFQGLPAPPAPAATDPIQNSSDPFDPSWPRRDEHAAAPPAPAPSKSGFDVVPIGTSQELIDARNRVNAALQAGGIGTARVQILGGHVVLRGTAATPQQRALAERLARMEPGVSRVENLVTIDPGAAKASKAATGK